MKQQTMNELNLCAKPLLAGYETDASTPVVAHLTEYDEDRMILVIEGQPAILNSGYYDMGATKVTFVKQETTDDE